MLPEGKQAQSKRNGEDLLLFDLNWLFCILIISKLFYLFILSSTNGFGYLKEGNASDVA